MTICDVGYVRYKLFFVLNERVAKNYNMKKSLKLTINKCLEDVNAEIIEFNFDRACLSYTLDMSFIYGRSPSTFLNGIRNSLKNDIDKNAYFKQYKAEELLGLYSFFIIPITIVKK